MFLTGEWLDVLIEPQKTETMKERIVISAIFQYVLDLLVLLDNAGRYPIDTDESKVLLERSVSTYKNYVMMKSRHSSDRGLPDVRPVSHDSLRDALSAFSDITEKFGKGSAALLIAETATKRIIVELQKYQMTEYLKVVNDTMGSIKFSFK